MSHRNGSTVCACMTALWFDPVQMRKKSDLPVKICAACGRPMVWRKAWEKVWDEVKYCSDACRKKKGGAIAPPQEYLIRH